MDTKKTYIKLNDIKSPKSFRVPESYFDGLQADIMAKVNCAEKPEKRSYGRPVLVGLAACLAVWCLFMFSPNFGILNKAINSDTDTEWREQFQDYLAYNMDSYLILEEFLDDYDNITTETYSSEILDDDTKDAIEDYLLNNYDYSLW